MKSAAPAVGATAAAAAAATAATAAATAAAPEVGVPPPTPPAESEEETEDGAVEEEEQPKAEEQGDGAETAVAAEAGHAQVDVSADGGEPNQSAAAEQGAIHVFFVCARTCIRVRVADGLLLLFFFCAEFFFVSFFRLLSMSGLLPLCLSFSYYPPSPPPAPHPPRAHPRIGDDVSRFVSVAYTTTPCLAVRQKPRVALFP